MNLSVKKIFRFIRTGEAQTNDYKNYKFFLDTNKIIYPKSYFNLTIDFELMWSRSRRGDSSTTLEESVKRSERVRKFTPILLSLSEKYNIPITFAVVGHAALKDCSDHNSPPPFRPKWIEGDWYNIDPDINFKKDNNYYGGDLLEKITNSYVGHSIASHGFSHVDIGDIETTENVAKFEIEESFNVLKKINPKLTTYVFVKNHPAYKKIIKNTGFTIYRNNKNHEIKYDEFKLIQFPLGLWISPEAYSVLDLVKLINVAITRKQLINFWYHLYEFKSLKQFHNFFEPIFSHIDFQRKANTIEALTMEDIVFKTEVQ